MASADDIRVNVLGPVQLVVNGVPVPLEDKPVLTRLLTLLALGPTEGIAATRLTNEIWSNRAADQPKNSLQQAVRRLRRIGLENCLPHEHSGRYRLDLSADRVDARRLIAAANALGSEATPSGDELDEVLALWRGDPTADPEIANGYGNAVREARRRLQAERARRARPRLLIIDDKVGYKIKSILGDYRCTVMTGVEEFWLVADRCDELFDAALVDLHLTDGCGAEGRAVLDSLRQSSVPAILMTYRPQPGEPDAVVRRYNLLGFHIKASNTEDGDFTGLRDLVNELVGSDAEAILLPRLDEELARRERKAGKLIELTRRGDVAKSAMQRDVDRIRAIIRRGGPLTAARQAMAEFNDAWLPGER